MTDQFPDITKMVLITPPPERFKQWEDDILNERDNVDHVLDCAWRDGFQAGADQELEACIRYFHEYDSSWGESSELISGLRAARRPKPPSLKEQALEALDEEHADMRIQNYKLIRSVLESLPS